MNNAFATPLARLDAAIEREILRLRARYQLSLDEFRGLYVSDEQVDELIAGAQPAAAPSHPIDAAGERLTAGLRDASPRWRRMAEAFALSPLDEEVVFVAAAAELDLKYETLFGYLNNDVTRKWPTAALTVRLLGASADTSAVIQALAPAARLHAQRLLRRIDSPATQPSLLNAGYALDACLAHWLHGQSASAAFDGHGIAWLSHADTVHAGAAASVHAAILRLLAQGDTRTMPTIALVGEEGSGRWRAAVATAAAAGRPLAHVDLRAAAPDEAALAGTLDRLRLAITLEPAVVLIEGFEPAGDEEPRTRRRDARIASAIARWPASALVMFRTSADERWRACAGRRAIEIPCDAGGFTERVAHWREAARLETVAVADSELRDLAGRFALTPGHARAALATARDVAAMHGAATVDAAGIAAAARHGSDQALGRLATKVERAHDWADLVLPPATLRRLRELAAAIRHRHVVYGEWGFRARMIAGTGINALFAGGSGTGKTMAAGVIARELGLDLYKIDLSGIVSKYIGETEKNLDRIFRAARGANAIVFLDEAEALLGKRSEVKDAHDRYANIEVAYLLQKLEGDAIVVLATNLKQNIDDAFSRRMHYVIDFPRPNDSERERIWRGMFPPQSPLAPDIDFPFLARQFDLAGGDIRNVALDAAFLAAQDGGVIGMRAIVQALSRQLTKQGKMPTGLEFRQYRELLPAVRDGV